MDRIVLDTNQIVSGLLTRRGLQADLLDAWQERCYLLITSPFLFSEVQAVLAEPKLKEKYRLKESQIEKFLTLLKMESFQVPGLVHVKACRDPDDDAILGCAVEGEADFIVTGDSDLLVLKEYKGIRILTARHYLEHLHLK